MKFSRKNYENHKSNPFFVRKQLIVLAIAFFGCIYTMNAQEISSNAIGLRFGDNDGFGAEISYQRKLTGSKRLELGLGFRDNRNFSIWKLSGIHQWVWNIDGGFNWYAGVGAGIGNVDFGRDGSDSGDGLFVNAAGTIGVEYNFDIPLLISLDFRPEFGLVNSYTSNDIGTDIALGLRFQF